MGHGGRVGMPVERAKDFRGTTKRLLGYFVPHRVKIIVVLLSAVLSTIFSIVSPKILGNVTTMVYEGAVAKLQGVPGAGIDFAGIGKILVFLVALYVLGSVFGYIQQYLMAGVAQQIVYAMRKDINEKLARLPLKFFDSRTHGELMSRVINDMDNISNTLQQSLTQLLTSVVMVLGTILMMLVISPFLTLMVIIILPLSFLLIKAIATRSQPYFLRQQQELGELNGHIEEVYTGHLIVKAFGREERTIAQFDAVNEKLYESSWRAQFISGMMMPLMIFINNISYVLVSVAGGILVTRRLIEIGDVQAFIQYTRQFSHPIAQAANIANVFQSTIASAERVFEILDEEEEESEREADALKSTPKGDVRFQDVSFGYVPGQPVIKNLNINVKAGQTVAIVGPTGAGKTTLINLLMRFYELDGGRITIDGVDISAMSRDELRQLFGMVLQDTWLFHGTIRDNIAYGRPGATDEDVVRAAKAAHADHFIRTLPDGYDTMINEEASNISQGQKQLLTIARAVLADPTILILDEATSSVDTRTEAVIQTAMNELMQGRTSFVIAHRLSTIRHADLILVMNDGRIIEQGTHDELLKREGFYADLFYSQFRGGGAVAHEVV